MGWHYLLLNNYFKFIISKFLVVTYNGTTDELHNNANKNKRVYYSTKGQLALC